MKLNKLIALSLCALSLSTTGCNPAVLNQLLTPNPQIVPIGENEYSFPLRYQIQAECSENSQLRYEVNANGQFRYASQDIEQYDMIQPAERVMKTVQLLAQDFNQLQRLLDKADLKKLQQESIPIPPDTPQTTECRDLEVLQLKIKRETLVFDSNGREYKYSEAYLKAFAEIRDFLETLKARYENNPNPVEPVDPPEPEPVDPPEPLPPGEGYHYALPLSWRWQQECGGQDLLRYEVSEEGHFHFADMNVNSPDLSGFEPIMHAVQLSPQDLDALLDTMQNVNLARHFEASRPVSGDTPQTMECRLIDMLRLNVNGSHKTFDFNGRQYAHSEIYLAAFNRLRDHLEELARKYSANPTPVDPQPHVYRFPLRYTQEQECGGQAFVQYEVDEDQTFIYPEDSGDQLLFDGQEPVLKKVRLVDSDFKQLEILMQEMDLARHFSESSPVPADAPQTKECRTIEYLNLQLNGSPQSYDYNGRQYNHTDAYRHAFEELRAYLKELSQKYSETNPPVEPDYHYGLPLRIQAEGECGMGLYDRYKIDENGVLTYALEVQAPAEGDEAFQARKQLDDQQLEEVISILNELNLIRLFNQLEVYPPDAPQTDDCRTLEILAVTANGQSYTLQGRQSRGYVLSEDYIIALERLERLLQEYSG